MEQLRDLREMHSALSRLIRRPMRRWWLSVGIWFLLLCCVLIVYSLWVDHLYYGNYGHGLPGNLNAGLPFPGMDWTSDMAQNLLLIVAALGWVLVATVSRINTASVLKDVAVASAVGMDRARFLLMLVPGWPFALAVLMSHTSLSAPFELGYEGWGALLQGFQENTNDCLNSFALPMAWVILLLLVQPGRQWVGGAFLALQLLLPQVIESIHSLPLMLLMNRHGHSQVPSIPILSNLGGGELVELHFLTSWAFGGLVLVSLLLAFARGRLAWAYMAFAVLSVSCFLAAWGPETVPLHVRSNEYLADASDDWMMVTNYLRSSGRFARTPLLAETRFTDEGTMTSLGWKAARSSTSTAVLSVPVDLPLFKKEAFLDSVPAINLGWVVVVVMALVWTLPRFMPQAGRMPALH